METTPCPCKKKKCPRHGDCDACREYHAEHSRYPVYCERKAKKELRKGSE